MPTLLDAVGAPIPDHVDGASLLPLLRGQGTWRDYVHGEMAHCSPIEPGRTTGMQFLTDGTRKYIWYPGIGREQFFDLSVDPGELSDLSETPERAAEVGVWRARLVRELAGRPEGFTDGERLLRLDGPTRHCLNND